MILDFKKYQGTGNDFIMIDNRSGEFKAYDDFESIARLCDRRFGIGADGFIILENAEGYDFRMIYYNADGREGSMCGNGGRSIVAFAYDLGVIKSTCKFIAVDGEHDATIENNIISLKMNNVSSVEKGDDYYFLDTGSPHYVSFVDNVADLNVVETGRSIRYNDRFKSEGTNVNFSEDQGNNNLYVRTYERGVENETLSCGTGVTACALSALMQGFSSPVAIKTLGGNLSVSADVSASGGFENVHLIGPAEYVFSGQIDF